MFLIKRLDRSKYLNMVIQIIMNFIFYIIAKLLEQSFIQKFKTPRNKNCLKFSLYFQD